MRYRNPILILALACCFALATPAVSAGAIGSERPPGTYPQRMMEGGAMRGFNGHGHPYAGAMMDGDRSMPGAVHGGGSGGALIATLVVVAAAVAVVVALLLRRGTRRPSTP